MSYAIFSKRTKVISRIIDDLTSLLPSESMIEVDPTIVYSRGYKQLMQGQKANTMGFPLFLQEASTPVINPQTIAFDTNDRPYVAPNTPIFESPEDPAGNPVTVWKDVPIVSHPFVWTAYEVAMQKYEGLLAENYPFQVVIGEEFITDEHIDTAASDKIVLSEGRCFIAPGGELVTDEFQFLVTSRGVIDPIGVGDKEARQFVFDTYYLRFEPQLPQGVSVFWRTRAWSDGATISEWTNAIQNEQRLLIPYDEPLGADIVVPAMGIELKVINYTGDIVAIENFMLLLRVQTLPYTPA